MKGIILTNDPAINDYLKQCFPDWFVGLSNTTKEAIEFYPLPPQSNPPH